MKKKYTHIFFDLDNTLWDFKTNSKQAMLSAYNHHKLNCSKINFDTFFEEYSKHNDNLWAAYRKKEVRKNDLTRMRFQNTFDAFSIKGIEPQEMNDTYLREMPKQSVLLDGAIKLLDYLKNKQYKLFIITNGFREVQHKKLQSAGLAPYFDKVFISEDVKTPKPGREIFEYAIKSANAKKKYSLMIGDDLDVDVKGAIDFGIDAIYFPKNNSEETKDISGIKSISNLSELRTIL